MHNIYQMKHNESFPLSLSLIRRYFFRFVLWFFCYFFLKYEQKIRMYISCENSLTSCNPLAMTSSEFWKTISSNKKKEKKTSNQDGFARKYLFVQILSRGKGMLKKASTWQPFKLCLTLNNAMKHEWYLREPLPSPLSSLPLSLFNSVKLFAKNNNVCVC